MARRVDLTGKKFGNLTVVKFSESRKGVLYWECDCSCGARGKTIRGDHLKSGNTSSCGCGNIKDITGEKFGMLKAIKPSETRKGRVYWLCECDCGNETVSSGADLRNGKIVSCGCSKIERIVEIGKRNRKQNYFIEKDGHYEVYDENKGMFLVDKDDKSLVEKSYWFIDKRYGYILNSEGERIHRIIMNAQEENIVDHRNGKKYDNRKGNLRLTNYHVNNSNVYVRKDNLSTGVLGISKRKDTGRYIASISIDGRSSHIGSFKTIEDAIKARKDAELEQRGELSYFWKNNPHL